MLSLDHLTTEQLNPHTADIDTLPLEDALLLCNVVLSHPFSEARTKSRAEQLQNSLADQLTPAQIEAARLTAQEMALDSIVKSVLDKA